MSTIPRCLFAGVLLVIPGVFGACQSADQQFQQSISNCTSEENLATGSLADASYDRFENVTTVAVIPAVQKLANQPFSASLGVFFRCQGKGACTPDTVRVAVAQKGGPPTRNEVVQAIFFVNGNKRIKSVTTGGVTGLEAVKGGMGGRALSLAYRDFVRVACADTVEYRIGDLEASLGPRERKGLRYAVSVAENAVPISQLRQGLKFFRQ